KEGIIAVTKKGKAGVEEINKIMNSLRDGNYKEIIGKKIKTIKDFKLSKELDIETGETKTIDLPSSDVIQFIFEDGTYITARPSGTEPKIKYYFCIIGKNSDEAEIKITNTMTEFEKFVDSLV
ncbi:MAG: phospho-sugar mutase, partial [Cetobacterium sp.]